MSKLDRELLDASIGDLLAYSKGDSITHPGTVLQRQKLAANEGKGRDYDHESTCLACGEAEAHLPCMDMDGVPRHQGR